MTQTAQTTEFTIAQGDIASFDADVVALKYAQDFHGADAAVAGKLADTGVGLDDLRPRVGDYRYVETMSRIKARHAVFVGVPALGEFGYGQIREFSASVLGVLAREAPGTRHLAMTVHGPEYVLDETEAILAYLSGYVDAQRARQSPPALERISIVDTNGGGCNVFARPWTKSWLA